MSAKYKASDEGLSIEDSSKGKTGINGKLIAIVILVSLLVGVAIGLIVYFTTYHKADCNYSTTTTAATTITPVTPLQPPSSPSGLRIDCLVNKLDKTREECLRRGCAWDDMASEDGDKCSLISSSDIGNMMMEVNEINNQKMILELSWKGEKRSLYSNVKDIIENITVEINELNDNVLRITFLDADDPKRFRVPIPLNDQPRNTTSAKAYNVTLNKEGEKFYVKVLRISDSTVIFDTSVADLVMEKQYLSLSTKAPTSNVYGFGENLHRTFRHQFNKSETWAMFARDQPPGQDPNQHYDNLYGVHPFYVCIEDSGKAHGVFLLNSNAQDVTLTPGHMITYRTIGGILDFFIFTGPTPENVIQEYTGLVGRPYMPPYWALGFQLCRYGYKNTSDIKAAVDRTRNAGIPHDVQYADIDYMDARKDFTIDPVNFAGLGAYFHELRTNYSMKTIIILDPAISIKAQYFVYPEGKDKDIYIKWPVTPDVKVCERCGDERDNMLGYVWPDNRTVFPDFFKNSTQDMWENWIVNQRTDIEFDGLWIDMNEPANFDTNKDQPWNWKDQRPGEPSWNLKCDMSHPLENPPYKTKACHIYAGELRHISDKTVCMVGIQGEDAKYTHYDVHNLYGWSQTFPTLKALRSATSKRGMVVSRSTFAGSGQHAGHWLGDNSANWQHLRDSIIGMLEFNLFGIPYVGADICGFFQDSNAQLCKRWMQLGAFYPFSRNHNGIKFMDHDPASFADKSVAELSKSSLETRYKLLPYLYTLFYEANTQGSTVVRSLQFEWPTDWRTLDINEQFMWGSSILFSPILYENQTTLTAYLPDAKWYDYYTENSMNDGNATSLIITPIDGNTEIPIHLRGGSIIPTKESALTTTESRHTAFTLLIALDTEQRASGKLFWDDGDSIDTSSSRCYVTFKAENQLLNSVVDEKNCAPDTAGDKSLIIDTVRVMGVNGTVAWVNKGSQNVSHVYDGSTLVIQNLGQSIADKFEIQWSY